MSSNRLTNTERDHIVKEEARIKFDSEIRKLDDAFKKELENEVKKIVAGRIKISDEMLASGYIRTSCSVEYKVKDENYSKTFSINSSYPILAQSYNFAVKKSEKIDDARDALIKKKDEKTKFEQELKKIVYGFTTKTNLIENIPEFEPYFKNTIKISKELVPMEQINNIRKQLPGFDITKKKDPKRTSKK